MKSPNLIPSNPSPPRRPEIELFGGELDSLLQAFCEDPSDDQTFGRLEVLLRGGGSWEIVPDRLREPVPTLSKRA